MKQILVLAALVVAAQAWGKWNKGLSVRFGVGIGAGRTFFISVPQTLTEAKNQRWVESTRPEGQPRSSLVLYNPSIDDVVLGAFYDTYGTVAGLQIALPQDSVIDPMLDWTTTGHTEWTAPANSTGSVRKYWTAAVYFVSEDEQSLTTAENKGDSRIYQEDYIYVTGRNGDLLPISTVASEVAETTTTLFTRQACVPFMGRHYYYNMTVLTECTSEGILSWFPLVDEASGVDQLIGVGYMNAVSLPASALIRDYFERPSSSDVEMIVPSGPNCLYNLPNSPGVLTMHIYFVDAPILINCLFS